MAGVSDDNEMLADNELSNVSDNTLLYERKPTKEKKSRRQKIRRRIRDPFNKNKVKDLKKRKEVLENALSSVAQKLIEMVATNAQGQNLIGSVETLQIDCTNTINQHSEEGQDSLQDRIDQLTEAATALVKDITQANERMAEESEAIKLSLKRTEIKLEEVTDLASQCLSKISEHDACNSQALKDLLYFKDAITEDLPDEKVVSDGVSALRLGIIIDEDYDFLPYPTKVLVTRLVHVFGHDGLLKVCKALRLELNDDILEQSYAKDGLVGVPYELNKDTCSRILVKWVNKSQSNNVDAILEAIKHRRKSLQTSPGCNHCLSTCFNDSNSTQNDTNGTRQEPNLSNDDINHGLDIPIPIPSEEKYVQTTMFGEYWKHYSSMTSLAKETDSLSSNKSLSFDEDYFMYNSLERDVLHLLKVLSVSRMVSQTNTKQFETLKFDDFRY